MLTLISADWGLVARTVLMLAVSGVCASTRYIMSASLASSSSLDSTSPAENAKQLSLDNCKGKIEKRWVRPQSLCIRNRKQLCQQKRYKVATNLTQKTQQSLNFPLQEKLLHTLLHISRYCSTRPIIERVSRMLRIIKEEEFRQGQE